MDKLDPSKILIRVIFLNNGPDGPGWRMYGFYHNKKGSVNELKGLIKEEFGWDIS